MEKDEVFNNFCDNLYNLYTTNSLKKCFEFAQGENRVLLMLLLAKEKNLTPSDFTDELNVSKQRTTNILNSLKKKEYIALQMDATDRRKINIALTKKGEEYISKKSDEVENEVKIVSDKLGKEKIQKLNELLEEINVFLK